MEVLYKSNDGQFELRLDVKDQASLFEQIADFQEIFESSDTKINGKTVPKEHIQFRVREVEGNKYYEKVYVGPDKDLWGYKLPFGQNKKGGTLFPKRKIDDEEKSKVKDGGNGWRKWLGDK